MKKYPIYSDFCIENLIYKQSRKTRIIYIVVILFIFFTLMLLPFIYVDIVVHSTGIVRPLNEKVEIKSSLNEIIEQIFVYEGDEVKIGDTILTLNTSSIDAKIKNQENIEEDCENQLSDLKNIIKSPEHTKFYFTSKRCQEQQLFQRQQEEIKLRINNANIKLKRNKSLYESGTIPKDEYENYIQEKDKNQNELNTLVESRITLCRSDVNDLKNKLSEIRSNLRQLQRERKMYTILAPINGTLDQFSGIYVGATLQNGQSIAIISPSSTLLVECYVLPKDIGFLYKGMPVNIQVVSFNYNQWGMLKGKITDISSDFLLSDNTAYYKVKCSVNRRYLKLKSGQKGYLKKGMTVQTRFQITERSLFQLLYQNFDEWVNPAIQASKPNKTEIL